MSLKAFNNLFDACTAQPACATKYGDVKEQVHEPGPATRGKSADNYEAGHTDPTQADCLSRSVLDGRRASELVVFGCC